MSMRRHAYGMVGFAASTLLSWALVFPFAPAAPARTYGPARLGWVSIDDNATWHTSTFQCSDGSRLYLVRRDCGSPERARAAYDALVELATTSVTARNVSRDGTPRAYLIFARDQIYDPERPPDLAHTLYAVAWVEGSRLSAIYGPTTSHVMELEAAQ